MEVSAQSTVAVNTTDHAHPFVKQADQIYQQYRDAEMSGDVDSYKRTRTNVAYEGTTENLKRMGKAASDLSPMLKRMGDRKIDLSRFSLTLRNT